MAALSDVESPRSAKDYIHGSRFPLLAAQQALYHRARRNRAARRGEYNAEMQTFDMTVLNDLDRFHLVIDGKPE
jgi:phosphoketolase